MCVFEFAAPVGMPSMSRHRQCQDVIQIIGEDTCYSGPTAPSLDPRMSSHLLMAFANSFDPDQARQNVGPDPGPNCWTL